MGQGDGGETFQESGHGGLGGAEEGMGIQPDEQDSDHHHRDADRQGEGIRRLNPARRFFHVHQHHDAEVVIKRYRAVQHPDDGQPNEPGIDRRRKEVELAHEPRKSPRLSPRMFGLQRRTISAKAPRFVKR